MITLKPMLNAQLQEKKGQLLSLSKKGISNKERKKFFSKIFKNTKQQ